MNRSRHARRAVLITAIAAVLTFVGGGSAAAYWSATASLTATAGTASVGLEVEEVDLNFTYDAANLVAASTVAIQNTGTREAAYGLTLRSTGASSLSDEISVAVGPVDAPADCTTTAELSGAQRGVISIFSFDLTGSVDAGDVVYLCVQTSVTPADAGAYAGAETDVELTSALGFGRNPSGAWLPTVTVEFTQKVGSSLLFFTDESGRYQIRSDGQCVFFVSDSGVDRLDRSAHACDGLLTQWRISRSDSGRFLITRANNERDNSAGLRWEASSSKVVGGAQTPLSTAQEWDIVHVSGDHYQFKSVAESDMCLAVGAPKWTGSTEHWLDLVTCDDEDEDQWFTFELIGTPFPGVQDLTCLDAIIGVEIILSFDPNLHYVQEQYDFVYLRHVDSDARVLFRQGAEVFAAEYTELRINRDDPLLRSFIDHEYGDTGTVAVDIEMQIAKAPAHLTATGQFYVAEVDGRLNVYCETP